MGRMRHALARTVVFAIASALLLASCATTQGRDRALQETQYAWSAAIRWGDFEGAWALVDPAWREAHPRTELERSRLEQIRISAYRDVGATASGDTARRTIDVGVINRNTLRERQLRHVEEWRWDPVAETWWVTNGLPDLWDDGD